MRSTTRLAIGFATLLVALFTSWAPAEAATPTLSVEDVEWFEEPRGTPSPVITVRLSAPTDQDVSVGLATVDGTAHGGWDAQGSDYRPILTRAAAAGRRSLPQRLSRSRPQGRCGRSSCRPPARAGLAWTSSAALGRRR